MVRQVRRSTSKKSKNHILNGVTHIKSTFNNTIVTISDLKGDTISWSSAGSNGFKGAKKGTPFAAQMAAEKVSKEAIGSGVKQVEVLVSGPGAGREAAIRALQTSGLEITLIRDITPVPHNGCRPPKKTKSITFEIFRRKKKEFSFMTSFQVKVIESTINEPINHYSKYAIEGLEQGQGLTVGNALRRIMLSELEGISVVAARITNANHEFSTIPGVREDAIEVLLNLKELIFSGTVKGTQISRLKVQGPGIVIADQFELPSQVKLVDPSQYIATISDNTILEIEMHIEEGQGYSMVEKKTNLASIQLLPIDSVFMPVRKVNYDVEQVLSKQGKGNDRLILEIWTNGSITPQEAISRSAQKLIDLFSKFCSLNFSSLKPITTKKDLQTSQILIEELHLSVRAYNCLKRAQIHSIEDLLHYSKEDLLEIKNFGQKSAQEVVDALEQHLDIKLEEKDLSQIEKL